MDWYVVCGATADFEGALTRIRSVDANVFGTFPSHRPIWWELLDGWPEDVQIHWDRETDDIWSDGTYGIPPERRTLLTNERIWLERDGGFGPDHLYRNFPEKWHIKSYLQVVEDGQPRIGGILCPQPPPWGWWMPSLKELT